jgi:lipopolysaccharide biosynthesis protein
MSNKKIRAIAIYLPQYHPTPENDLWWGKGFTEWTNVTKATPLFKDHYQPHLPADLGFYDLRIPEVREEQANMARIHGIYGFCYYHYWFTGKRILERPFQEVFESGKPDFPFMLCWANENWTRVWDGSDNEILLEQKYSEEDDKKHIQFLIPFFKDKRYVRIKDKPVVAIYRSTLLPDVAATIKIWREEAAKHDLHLYICRFESFSLGGKKYLNDGFDAAIDFQPWGSGMQQYKRWQLQQSQQSFGFRVKNFFYRNFVKNISEKKYPEFKRNFRDKILNDYVLDYNDYVNFLENCELPDYKLYPCVMPMWDNTARRKKNDPSLFYNSSPELYKKWLSNVLRKFGPYSEEENLVFINAWNEWAEGNHLEPCQKWGSKYLQATLEALKGV